MKKTFLLAFASLFVAAACSSDSTSKDPAITAPSGTSSGLPTDSSNKTNNNGTPGAVAGIRVTPQSISVTVGSSIGANVTPVDANGVQSLALLAGRPVWSIVNTAIATVLDSGFSIRGVAAGTTKLYVTWGTFKDSATIVVTKAGDTPKGTDSTKTGDTLTTPPPPNGPFIITAYNFVRTPATSAHDTGSIVQLPGATVSLYKLSAAATTSDSLSVRTLVSTVTADANGKAVFAYLPSTVYLLISHGTYGGVSVEGQSYVSSYSVGQVQVALYLSH
ncbi:MAG: hypothetical protein ABJB66_04265, partial [Gemmatimonadaceae bacterium]